MKKYVLEIENVLKRSVINDPEYKASREKTTGLMVLGHRLPLMQKIEKNGFSFYNESPSNILNVWDIIWKETNIHEAMYLPLFYYRRHKKEFGPKEWKVIKKWVDRIENWEHADALCYLYSLMYENHPALVEPTLFKWNKSKNLWKRRCSVVSTIYYASKKRTPPKRSVVFKLFKPLLSDKEPYIQKAVGWQLRESYNLWPKETLTLIESHLTTLPATTFSYATEKIPAKKKSQLKAIRKAARLDKK